MKKTITRLLTCTFLAAIIFFSSQYSVNAATLSGRVSSSILNIRTSKSTKGKKLKTIYRGKKVHILESGSKWVKVKVGNTVGYTKGKYIKTSYGTASNLYSDAISGTSTKKMTVRSGKSDSSTAVSSIKKGSKVEVLSTNSNWVKVKIGDRIGYVRGKYVKTKNGTASNNSTKGEDLVNYAKRFLGNPYVYGGTSLTNGADCSGFVLALYRHFGYKLPHSSSAMRHVGRAVHGGIKNAKPGDIICYSGHVAIYMGNNRVIHASNPSSGIKITNNASYRHIKAIRRIFK